MRLYEVLTDSVDSKIRLYKPTDQHFPSTSKFLSEAKKHGDDFQAKIWILLPQGKNQPEEIVIRPVKKFQINLFNENGIGESNE